MVLLSPLSATPVPRNMESGLKSVYLNTMPFLRLIMLLLAGALAVAANPFAEAESAFLAELNSMEGIALFGGPFHSSEQHHFEGESGYFVLAPDVILPTLDQRLSVQTRIIESFATASNTLPIAASPHARSGPLTTEDRRDIHIVLAQNGFGARRDEITLFDDGAVQSRPVQHLALLKTSSIDSNTCMALLGAQPWQGVPLYRASFDRTRGDFELETLRVSFVPRRRHELPGREPIFNPQTFFAEAALAPSDWSKLLRHFSRLDLPAVQILEATATERLITLYADIQRPVLPQYWIKLKKEDARWQVTRAVEFRAEFPRPGTWWTFLPLLPESPASVSSRQFASSAISTGDQKEVTAILHRLRGAGKPATFAVLPHSSTLRVRTTHDPWRGYHLDFARLQNSWRITSVSEWTE